MIFLYNHWQKFLKNEWNRQVIKFWNGWVFKASKQTKEFKLSSLELDVRTGLYLQQNGGGGGGHGTKGHQVLLLHRLCFVFHLVLYQILCHYHHLFHSANLYWFLPLQNHCLCQKCHLLPPLLQFPTRQKQKQKFWTVQSVYIVPSLWS